MYGRDITYGTASEFGFDYLRDNGMATRKEDQVQRDHWYCIVDEIDSILVDEARTPLIISGPAPIEREQPFTRLQARRSTSSSTTRRASATGSSTEAEGDARKDRTLDADDERATAARKLLQVKMGNPKNKQLLRLMENAGVAQAARQDRDRDEFRPEQGRALPAQGGPVLRHRRAPAPGRPDRNRPHQAAAGQSRRVRAARPRDRVSATSTRTRRSRPRSARRRNSPRSSATPRSPRRSTPSRSCCAPIRSTSATSNTSSQDGKVMIVDENTGRVMPGRRWSDGLHQAVEAKEERRDRARDAHLRDDHDPELFPHVREARRHDRHGGDRGDRVQRHLPARRCRSSRPTSPASAIDRNDSIFKTRRDKYNAVVSEIEEAATSAASRCSSARERRVLRGAVAHAQAHGRHPHRPQRQVPPAGGRDRRAAPASAAPSPSPPTWPAAAPTSNSARACANSAACYVIGTERHESRRIDRQLRGRCSRQGDPGLTQVFPLARGRPDAALPPGQPRLAPDGGLDAGGRGARAPAGSTARSSPRRKRSSSRITPSASACCSTTTCSTSSARSSTASATARIHAERPKDIIFEQIEEELATRLESRRLRREGRRRRRPRSRASSAGSTRIFPISLRVDELTGDDLDGAADDAARADQAGLRGEGIGRDARGARRRSSATSSSTRSTTTGRST